MFASDQIDEPHGERNLAKKHYRFYQENLLYRTLVSELMVLHNIKLCIVFNYILWAYSKAKSSTSIK